MWYVLCRMFLVRIISGKYSLEFVEWWGLVFWRMFYKLFDFLEYVGDWRGLNAFFYVSWLWILFREFVDYFGLEDLSCKRDLREVVVLFLFFSCYLVVYIFEMLVKFGRGWGFCFRRVWFDDLVFFVSCFLNFIRYCWWS